jgi:hypothetical protein
MIVDPDFFDHWKTRMVVDALGGDELAPLYIMRLWAHCQTRKGEVFDIPTSGIKAICKYAGEAKVLEDALVSADYLIREDKTVTIVGWLEKNASLVAAWSNGNLGGRPPKAKKETHGEPMENPRVTHGKPTDNPRQTHGEPIREDKSREDIDTYVNKLPVCPTDEVISLYHEHLPQLPTVRVMNIKRQKAIGTFWKWVLTSKRGDGSPRAQTADQALTWIGEYFRRASGNDFLMGRSGGTWTADLDFLLSEKGKIQVIEKTKVAA